ncbi:hypothetical protein BKA63DRAFT_542291 [Paraphoma chrysanthemicola]|nr:hypothetical protein BKA63DRAFT_542291 [Paraphoma chrysanthemicola]
MNCRHPKVDTTTHTPPFLIVDSGSDTEVFFSPLAEARNPLSSSASVNRGVNINEEFGKARRPIVRLCSNAIRRSHSESLIRNQSPCENEAQSHDAGTCRRKETQSLAHASLRALRPSAQRTHSSPQVELQSRHHKPSTASVALTRELMGRTGHTSMQPLLAEPAPRVAGFGCVTEDSGLESAESTLRGRFALSTISDQDLRNGLDQTKQYTPQVPLKTCLEEQAHSTTTTPPSKGSQLTETSLGNKKLRRVKTVDFEDVAKPSPVLPTFATPTAAQKVRRPRTSTGIHVPPSNVANSCPGSVYAGKSGLADPATTRTDVHVIAIAPSRIVDSKEDLDNVDPATPIMQIVESSNGCYEVVWDNVPDEHRIRTHRRSSSASHSLQAINTPSIGALRRVNTKLIDSSGTWNAPSNIFKPTIVHVPGPPNSKHTSAGPSRSPSRPASAPASQAVSEEEIELKSDLEDLQDIRPDSDGCTPTKKAYAVPDTKVHLTRLFAPSRRIRHTTATRRPSSLEYTDIKFRGHRDSIVLARSRLVHSSDFSEVVLAHRDSLSMAKKRMRTRNHAISTARDIPKMDQTVQSDATFSFPGR